MNAQKLVQKHILVIWFDTAEVMTAWGRNQQHYLWEKDVRLAIHDNHGCQNGHSKYFLAFLGANLSIHDTQKLKKNLPTPLIVVTDSVETFS